jgi:hypothetical protein
VWFLSFLFWTFLNADKYTFLKSAKDCLYFKKEQKAFKKEFCGTHPGEEAQKKLSPNPINMLRTSLKILNTKWYHLCSNYSASYKQ